MQLERLSWGTFINYSYGTFWKISNENPGRVIPAIPEHDAMTMATGDSWHATKQSTGRNGPANFWRRCTSPAEQSGRGPNSKNDVLSSPMLLVLTSKWKLLPGCWRLYIAVMMLGGWKRVVYTLMTYLPGWRLLTVIKRTTLFHYETQRFAFIFIQLEYIFPFESISKLFSIFKHQTFAFLTEEIILVWKWLFFIES